MATADAASDGIARSVAGSTAALVSSRDLAHILARLLDDCVRAVGVGAAGVMVRLPDGSIEVLSASSHHALELELYQSQVHSGPCLDCITTGEPVTATSPQQMREHWPAFADSLTAAGFTMAYAQPMSWQGTVIGGLNLFGQAEAPLSPDASLLAEAFADMATIAVIHAGHVSAGDVLCRTRAALSTRNIVEQAKGVLAYRDDLDMAAAYEQLKRLTAESQRGLAETAAEIIRQAHQR